MNHAACTRLLASGVIVAVVLCSCIERVPRDIPIDIPSVGTLFEPEPMLTTSIADATTGVPFLDEHDPKGAIIMTALPRTPGGGFVLDHPGYYQFEAKSYCISPGKHSPGSKGGFLFAPLEGPRAGVVQAIVERSYKHPKLAQTDVQSLLWAVISRTKISDMSPGLQRAARTLLTRREIRRLNGGALGMIPDEVLDRALAELPPPAQKAYEAEARLREMLGDAATTYEELERVAVRLGQAPPGDEDVDVPRGRWSFHPDGYFVRYLPRGYSRTCITIYVPAPCAIDRDKKGRISAITGFCGRRIEVNYDDSVEPVTVPGTGAMGAYAFRSIRLLVPDKPVDGKPQMAVTEWKDTGWTCSGIDFDVGSGHAEAPTERFSGLEERRDWGRQHRMEYIGLTVEIDEFFGRKSRSQMLQASRHFPEIVRLGHFVVGLKEALKNDKQHAAAAQEAIALAERAWMAAVATELGAYKPSRFLRKQQAAARHGAHALIARLSPGGTWPRLGSSSGMSRTVLIQSAIAQGVLAAPDDDPTFNPGGGAAAPGSMATQVVLNSPSGTDVADCKAKAYGQLEKDIQRAWDKTGPGGMHTCDIPALSQCYKAYPKEKRHRCPYMHCRPFPEFEGHEMLLSAIMNALATWAKAEKDCEK